MAEQAPDRLGCLDPLVAGSATSGLRVKPTPPRTTQYLADGVLDVAVPMAYKSPVGEPLRQIGREAFGP